MGLFCHIKECGLQDPPKTVIRTGQFYLVKGSVIGFCSEVVGFLWGASRGGAMSAPCPGCPGRRAGAALKWVRIAYFLFVALIFP